MRQRRETVEHPFGTIKARMGATHFLMKTLPRVAGEMALHVLAYNLTRVMNIVGVEPAPGGDEGIRIPQTCAPGILPHSRPSGSYPPRSTSREKSRQTRQADPTRPSHQNRDRVNGFLPRAFLHDQDPRPTSRNPADPDRFAAKVAREWQRGDIGGCGQSGRIAQPNREPRRDARDGTARCKGRRFRGVVREPYPQTIESVGKLPLRPRATASLAEAPFAGLQPYA